MGRSICETLLAPPADCNQWLDIKVAESETKRDIFWTVIAYIIALMLGLFVVAVVCIRMARRSARQEVNEEVRKSVASYFSMKETQIMT